MEALVLVVLIVLLLGIVASAVMTVAVALNRRKTG
jgi:hypothetical protein